MTAAAGQQTKFKVIKYRQFPTDYSRPVSGHQGTE